MNGGQLGTGNDGARKRWEGEVSSGDITPTRRARTVGIRLFEA